MTANDTDLDGHTSALCAKAPGDDCDDAQASVYTGAPELLCTYSEPARASGLTGTAAGYTLALFGTPAATNFRELSASCEAGILVPTRFAYPNDPTLASSPSSYLNLWADTDGNSLFSTFGANYCN